MVVGGPTGSRGLLIRSEVSVEAPVEAVAAAVAAVAPGGVPAGGRCTVEPAAAGVTAIVLESPDPTGPAAGVRTAARRARQARVLWRVERHVAAPPPSAPAARRPDPGHHRLQVGPLGEPDRVVDGVAGAP